MKLEGLSPGQPGYTQLMLERVSTLAPELASMYEPALLRAIASPGRALRAELDGSPEAQALVAQVDLRFAEFTGFVAYANASYVHASRLDALEAMLEIGDSQVLAEVLGEALHRIRTQFESAPATIAPLAPAAPLAELFALACVSLGQLLARYGDYQRCLLEFDADNSADQALRDRVRTEAQATHRAVGSLVEIPHRMPHAASASLVHARAAGIVAAGLGAIGEALEEHESAAVSAAISAVNWVDEAVGAYVERASACQEALFAARAGYRAIGQALDRAAGSGGERFTSELVLIAQLREVLAVERGVRIGFLSQAAWKAASREILLAGGKLGIGSSTALGQTLSAVEGEIARYAGGVGALEELFGELDRAIGAVLGPSY